MLRRIVRDVARAAGVFAVAAAVAMGGPSSLNAQGATFTFFGETAGDDVSLLLGDVDFVFGAGTLRPVLGLQSYVVMDEAVADSRTLWAVTPSVGIRYALPTGFFQGKVGYSWMDADDDLRTPIFGGGETGVTTTLHGEHWGDGSLGLQGIAAHNWGGEYLWTRARGTVRVLPSPSGSVHAGLEGGWQGHTRSQGAVDDIVQPNYSATMVGPILQWVTPNVIGGLGGGWKQSSGGLLEDDQSTWYARVELTSTPW
jgi:hypothetical protein